MSRKKVNYCMKKLSNRAHAADARFEVTGNDRVCYYLLYRENIGFEWVEEQIYTAAGNLGIDVQMWKVYAVEDGFEISVKEVDKRKDLDTDQQTIDSW